MSYDQSRSWITLLFKAQKVIQIANPLSSSGGGTNSENNKNS